MLPARPNATCNARDRANTGAHRTASPTPMTSPAPTPDVDRLAMQVPARLVRVGAQTFSYRQAGTDHPSGSRAPIVLLHGIGSSSASWVPMMTRLQDTFRLIAWDAPGYADSTPLAPAAPAAADYAAALAQLLDALAIERTVLVGHSLGALMAASFARQHSARVARLLLADPASGYGLADEATRNERLHSRLKLMNELGPQGMAERRAAQLLSPNASADALALVRWSMRRLRPDGHEQAAHMLAAGRLIEDVAHYNGQTLVVCGSEDKITPEDGCRKVAQACSNGTYRTLPGLGHACYVEAPQTLADVVREFASA